MSKLFYSYQTIKMSAIVLSEVSSSEDSDGDDGKISVPIFLLRISEIIKIKLTS